MITNTEKIIQDYTDRVVKEFDPEKVILFGSQAAGSSLEGSDIDLLVVKETSNTRELARRIDAVLFPRYRALDLVVSTPSRIRKALAAGDFFFTEVFAKGRVLYEANR